MCRYKKIEILEAGACIGSHIHMCLSIPPKYKVSDIMGHLKGKTAILLFGRYPELRKKVNGRSLWTRSYYINTVGLDEKQVRKYIMK